MRVIGVKKTYVEVNADIDVHGQQHPRYITWGDGEKLTIDRIREAVPAASLKAGGAGLRYTVDVLGRQTYLFLEDTNVDNPYSGYRWFVEEKIWADERTPIR